MKVKFKNILYIKGRIGWQLLKKNEYLKTGDYYLITGVDIQDNHLIDFSQCYYVSKERYEMDDKIQVHEGDIIVTKDGTIGKIGFIDKLDKPATLNSHLFLIRNLKPDILDSKYLFYLLQSDLFKKYATNNTSGSNIPAFTQKNIEEFETDLPSLEIQRKIAKTLDLYDSKINNNLQIIKELLCFGEETFDRWFLQFDFPDEKGKPYKATDGMLVYSDKIKNNIPCDWKIRNIKDICEIVWGQCPDGKNILPLETIEKDTLLYCSGAGDMRNGIVVDCQAKTNASRREAEKGDILMSVAGSIGALCICDQHISLGRAAVSFRPKEEELAFCYYVIKKYINRMMSVSSGSIQKVINDTHLDDINFAYSEEVVKRFSFVNDAIAESMVLSIENKELSKIRNELLLLLMNGQVSIK